MLRVRSIYAIQQRAQWEVHEAVIKGSTGLDELIRAGESDKAEVWHRGAKSRSASRLGWYTGMSAGLKFTVRTRNLFINVDGRVSQK